MSIDKNLLVLYAIFIAAVSLIFLLKASVDYRRAIFTLSRNSEAIRDIPSLLQVAYLKEQIQWYFFEQISNAIGLAYKPYFEATAKSLNSASDFKLIDRRIHKIDLDGLRKIPDLLADIEDQEKYVAEISAKLATDVTEFKQRAESIVTARQVQSDSPYYQLRINDSYNKITEAFDQCLSSWVRALDQLEKEVISWAINSRGTRPVDAVANVVNQIRTIRRLHAMLEICFPVVFALATILYVFFHSFHLAGH